MKRVAAATLLGVVGIACASLTPQGTEVMVYQANVAAPEAPAPPLPNGCRVLKSWGPIDQQEQARQAYDPYLRQRNEAAAQGGNVLLVRSYRFMTLKKIECTQSDAQGCPDSAQNWYKVSFDSYACNAAGLNALAELKPESAAEGILVWSGKKTTPGPAAPGAAAMSRSPATPFSASRLAAPELKSKVLALMREGIGSDVIVAYVRANRPASPLTAEAILDWKKSGVPDEIIRATFPN